MAIKFYYFDLRARAETARLILSYAKVPFEDIRIAHGSPEWLEVKKKMPFGQMPALEVDGQILAQSQTINRYLAKKYGLAGKDEWEAALVDQTAELYREYVDASSPYVAVSIGFMKGDKEAIRNEKLLPALEKYAPLFKKALDAAGSGFFAKSGPTYADFFVAEEIHSLYKLEKELVDSKYPWLAEHKKRVHALPELEEYLAKRTDSAI